MSIENAIINIIENNLDAMRANFSAALSEKAVQKLDERKRVIAENYFGLNESDLPITKKKEKSYTYKHKTSGKEISSVKDPGKDWEKINEEQLDEKTIASKKAKKGTKYKVKSKGSDSEGSYVELRQGKRVKDSGDYDRGAQAFFMKKGTYGSAKDILKTVKE